MFFRSGQKTGRKSAMIHAEPLVNDTVYNDIVSIAGKDAFFAILETFYPVADELLASLRQACTENDCQTRKEAAHSLKGAAANIGAQRAAAVCAQLEECEPGAAGDLVASLEKIMPDTYAAFKSIGTEHGLGR